MRHPVLQGTGKNPTASPLARRTTCLPGGTRAEEHLVTAALGFNIFGQILQYKRLNFIASLALLSLPRSTLGTLCFDCCMMHERLVANNVRFMTHPFLTPAFVRKTRLSGASRVESTTLGLQQRIRVCICSASLCICSSGV